MLRMSPAKCTIRTSKIALHEWFKSPLLASLSCSPEPGIIPRISVVEFFQFAHDIANALEFLASNLYIHRDVAARNCLGECILCVQCSVGILFCFMQNT